MRIDCKRWEPALHDWLESWIANSACTAVGAHLRACPACRAKVEVWRAVGRALRELPCLHLSLAARCTSPLRSACRPRCCWLPSARRWMRRL
jgi:anti-sigma factor RsiW